MGTAQRPSLRIFGAAPWRGVMRPERGYCRDRSKQGSDIPLNQNRNQNRRRGRSNRGPGGGNQGNRIDSRARGNAPQMLEKYKKLAHDASLNGDRVQTEYYLQFADHYFRVTADGRAQKDDQQPQRSRHQDSDESDEDNDDRQQRAPRGRDDRDERDEEGQRGSEGDSAADEDDENPFVRESKPRRGRPRQNGAEQAAGLDPASLPPAIGKNDDAGEAERPRRRTRSKQPASAASDEDEAREAHG